MENKLRAITGIYFCIFADKKLILESDQELKKLFPGGAMQKL